MKYIFSHIFFLFPFLLFAQKQQPINLQTAVQMGLEQSKQLKLSTLKTEAYQVKVAQFKNSTIPTLSLYSNYSRLSNNIEPFKITFPNGQEQALNPQILNQFTNRVSLQEMIFAGFRANNTLKSMEFMEKATSLDYEKDKVEISNNIITAYLGLQKMKVSLAQLADSRKLLDARLQDVKNLEGAGMALLNDVLKVELAITNLEQTQTEVATAIQIANYNLGMMLGLAADTDIVTTEENSPKEVANLESYMTLALQNRAEVRAADYRAQAANYNIKVAGGNYYPTVSVGANYYVNRPNQRVFPQQDEFKNTWDAGVSLNWNLTNLYSTGKLKEEANVSLRQTEMSKEQLSEGIKMEVNAQYQSYLSALKKIEQCQKAIIQATENQRLMKNRYDDKLVTLTDLLEADTQLLQAQINVISAKIDAQSLYYKLLKAVGK